MVNFTFARGSSNNQFPITKYQITKLPDAILKYLNFRVSGMIQRGGIL